MPTLHWIGKAAVVTHHKEVPFRLLEPVPELSARGAASLSALSAESECERRRHHPADAGLETLSLDQPE